MGCNGSRWEIDVLGNESWYVGTYLQSDCNGRCKQSEARAMAMSFTGPLLAFLFLPYASRKP